MSEKMTEKTYRIEGLSCTNCAGKFEKNSKKREPSKILSFVMIKKMMNKLDQKSLLLNGISL